MVHDAQWQRLNVMCSIEGTPSVSRYTMSCCGISGAECVLHAVTCSKGIVMSMWERGVDVIPEWHCPLVDRQGEPL
jgi:hypothetical protein